MTELSESTASVDDARRRAGNARIAVRWLPVEALRPDKRNARVHVPRQVARIADSIAAFGFNVPVLVDEKGGVLAGHGRVLAAIRLGLKEVPTIMLEHLSEAERRAFMISDNRLAELASWDDARLGLELQELKNLDLDFHLSATGFTIGEIDLRIEMSRTPGGRKPKQAPASLNGSAAARPGDVWTLGSSRLICGDDVEAAALLALDAAIRRWEAVSGESARLGSSGETFDELARARRRSKSGDAGGAVA
jgi:ParB-like chromosome segregation protein Spo0J